MKRIILVLILFFNLLPIAKDGFLTVVGPTEGYSQSYEYNDPNTWNPYWDSYLFDPNCNCPSGTLNEVVISSGGGSGGTVSYQFASLVYAVTSAYPSDANITNWMAQNDPLYNYYGDAGNWVGGGYTVPAYNPNTTYSPPNSTACTGACVATDPSGTASINDWLSALGLANASLGLNFSLVSTIDAAAAKVLSTIGKGGTIFGAIASGLPAAMHIYDGTATTRDWWNLGLAIGALVITFSGAGEAYVGLELAYNTATFAWDIWQAANPVP